ncbi:MAG: hypothetical protein UW94_C0001G0095 [Parcubacteria group bacterium GW2011_GWA2_45_14]|nr:MAG: hypothetical protein UW94_C0001G0095 [Parcubacteria group bacterium GW2011_GWA2_45_14]
MHNVNTSVVLFPVDRLLKERRKDVERARGKYLIHTVYARFISKNRHFIHVLSTINIALQGFIAPISTYFPCSTTTTILIN